MPGTFSLQAPAEPFVAVRAVTPGGFAVLRAARGNRPNETAFEPCRVHSHVARRPVLSRNRLSRKATLRVDVAGAAADYARGFADSGSVSQLASPRFDLGEVAAGRENRVEVGLRFDAPTAGNQPLSTLQAD